MPHDQDVEDANSPESESTYECLKCGRLTESMTHPGTCACGGEFQNRGKSLE
ncbi:rubrerythrin-like domain-containing protein [Halobellus ordinarius]|uniref:rubrerythrin-like domain-containing protein n=1 Tax=Halobellus ordinarius TaxID=3075120 RepID=UPI00288029FA|nr:rubrerythrin-like domain-containing protein [Halobellus sp. ZY16]